VSTLHELASRIFGAGREEPAPSIFLRMPRTGSSSINSLRIKNCLAFGGKSEGYWERTWPEGLPRLQQRVRDRVGDSVWKSHLKFSSVRNPWDRAVSMWRHPYFGDISFEDFCKRLRDDDFEPATLWHTQEIFYHLTDGSGHLVVDFVIRFERLQEDFDVVCDHLGIARRRLPLKAKAPREGVKKFGDYRYYYNNSTLDAIANKYKNDIDKFCYSFDGRS